MVTRGEKWREKITRRSVYRGQRTAAAAAAAAMQGGCRKK